MNEQIKINVPDGFHAVQNDDGTIDIVPGPGSESPTVTVDSVREKYRYEYWNVGVGWSAQSTTPWTANNISNYRDNSRPIASQVVRGIRAAAVITVEVAADDWEQVEGLVGDVEHAIVNINNSIE